MEAPSTGGLRMRVEVMGMRRWRFATSGVRTRKAKQWSWRADRFIGHLSCFRRRCLPPMALVLRVRVDRVIDADSEHERHLGQAAR